MRGTAWPAGRGGGWRYWACNERAQQLGAGCSGVLAAMQAIAPPTQLSGARTARHHRAHCGVVRAHSRPRTAVLALAQLLVAVHRGSDNVNGLRHAAAVALQGNVGARWAAAQMTRAGGLHGPSMHVIRWPAARSAGARVHAHAHAPTAAHAGRRGHRSAAEPAGNARTPMRKMRAGRRCLALLWFSVQLLMSAPVRRMISRTLAPAGPGARVGWSGS